MTGTPIDLALTAQALVAPGKGILAADESTPTIEKRFRSVGVESTAENCQAYREMLFTTPGVEAHISGVILFDETIRQASSDGTPFADLLASRGIIPGIKVDKGAKALAGLPGEKVTEGLDGLRERLAEYHDLGARFTKWRAVFTIGPGTPTRACIRANAVELARFAALSQEADLVPVVEPEVLMDGDHTIERSYEVTSDVIGAVFAELHAHRVCLEGALLKVNMVLSGYECSGAGDRARHRRVDPAVPQPPPAARRARGRLPLRRTVGGDGHHQSRCHRSHGCAPVATVVLVWTSPPGQRLARVGRCAD